MTPPDRPRLLFFRWIRPHQPPFLLQQLAEHVENLRLFFDVTLVDGPCDYDEVCDRHQPDLCLFESGIYVGARSVSRPHTHPEIPKLGFLNADAFDPVRATFVSDMAEWGVETFFTVSVSMADYTPEIADRLFCWPNAVDPAVHRDHGLPKTVPVLLTGSRARNYPWRNRVSKVLSQHYPTLSMPHFGWAQSRDSARMQVGETYARLINAAMLGPTCGSFTKDLVRKHLEIPANRTCLITERSRAVADAGFVDMENCVLADQDDVVAKVDKLLAEPDLLASITDAGHRLVHEQHTASQRRQIRDWYDLHRDGPLVQRTPFSPVELVHGAAEPRPAAESRPDRDLIDLGWRAVRRGALDQAQVSFARAANYHHMAETEVGSAFALLLQGRAAAAQASIETLLSGTRTRFGARDPDPVQLAVLLRAMLCRGSTAEAAALSSEHSRLSHEELHRIRWVLAAGTEPAPRTHRPPAPRASISPIPAQTWSDWTAELAAMLRANRQRDLARMVAALTPPPDLPPPVSTDVAGHGPLTGPTHVVPARTHRPGGSLVDGARRGASRLVGSARGSVRSTARRLVEDDWWDVVTDVAECEELDRVVVVGSSRTNLRERVLRRALAHNPRLPETVEVDDLRGVQAPAGPWLAYLGRRADPMAQLPLLRSARIVVVDDCVRAGATHLLDELTCTGEFELVAHDLTRRGGYAVLRHDLDESATSHRS